MGKSGIRQMMHALGPPCSSSHLDGTVSSVISGRLVFTFAVATVSLAAEVVDFSASSSSSLKNVATSSRALNGW